MIQKKRIKKNGNGVENGGNMGRNRMNYAWQCAYLYLLAIKELLSKRWKVDFEKSSKRTKLDQKRINSTGLQSFALYLAGLSSNFAFWIIKYNKFG